MDGNGRWAAARGLRRIAGHRRGVRAAWRVVEAAPALGVGTLTLFAFSSDNWKRPRAEVDGLPPRHRAMLDDPPPNDDVPIGVRIFQGVIWQKDYVRINQ